MQKLKPHNKQISLGILCLALLAASALPALAVSPDESRAKSLYVLDLKSGEVIAAKYGEAQLPIASITKVATAFAALNMFGRDREITITAEALETEGDSGLLVGETWNIVDLVKFMLIVSSNDATRALELESSDPTGLLNRMNSLAYSLGLDQTYFLNTSGLDISDKLAGAYSSAQDVSILLAEFYKAYPDVLADTTILEKTFVVEGHSHLAQNTNKYTDQMVGLLGSKTGSTDLAGANLSVIFDSEIGRPVVATALGSDELYRFPDVIALIYQTIENLSGKSNE